MCLSWLPTADVDSFQTLYTESNPGQKYGKNRRGELHLQRQSLEPEAVGQGVLQSRLPCGADLGVACRFRSQTGNNDGYCKVTSGLGQFYHGEGLLVFTILEKASLFLRHC